MAYLNEWFVTCISCVSREDNWTERESQGVGWDMSISLKLFMDTGSWFPET